MDELRNSIKIKYGSESKFAEHIGWNKQRLNKILNGKKEPTVNEIEILANGMKMSASKMLNYFLPSKSTKE